MNNTFAFLSFLLTGILFILVALIMSAPLSTWSFMIGGLLIVLSSTFLFGNDNSIPSITIPLPPTNISVLPGNASASVSFTPSNYATSYRVISYPQMIVADGAFSPIIINGLTNGTSYTFTMTATNSKGTSVSSTATSQVLINPIPATPTGIVVTSGVNQLSVGFSPSTHATSYIVTTNPGSIQTTGTSSPIIVSSLTNGVTYTCTVLAVNASGNSVESAGYNGTPNPAVPAPVAPTGVSAVASNASAIISFTASANATSYTVTSSPGGITASGSASPITITGLTNGTSYTFTVRATNATGTSVASSASNAVVPVAAPLPPTNVVATPGDSSASVSFTLSANATSYTVTSSPGGITASGSASPITVTGLTNGTSYTFTVRATNATGTSAASSASSAVTPFTIFVNPTTLMYGHSITITLSTAQTINSYIIGSAQSTIRQPTKYALLASSDGIKWALVDQTASNVVYSGFFSTRSIPSVTFKYYRIVVQSIADLQYWYLVINYIGLLNNGTSLFPSGTLSGTGNSVITNGSLTATVTVSWASDANISGPLATNIGGVLSNSTSDYNTAILGWSTWLNEQLSYLQSIYPSGNANTLCPTSTVYINFDPRFVFYYPVYSGDVNGTQLANYSSGTKTYDATLSVAGLFSSINPGGSNSGSILLTGSNFITLPSLTIQPFSSTNNGISISMWFKCTTAPSSSGYGLFEFAQSASLAASTSDTYSFTMGLTTSANQIMVAYANGPSGGGQNVQYNYATSPTSFMNWTHLVLTMTNGTRPSGYTIYINGSIPAGGLGAGYSNGTQTTPTYPNNGSYPYVMVGNSNYTNWNGLSYFKGNISNVRFYNRLLNESDVAALYTNLA
jgi:hypothetical protein